jgi:hypothetical protein
MNAYVRTTDHCLYPQIIVIDPASCPARRLRSDPSGPSRQLISWATYHPLVNSIFTQPLAYLGSPEDDPSVPWGQESTHAA